MMMSLHYLHGFLGKSEDWNSLVLGEHRTYTYNLFSHEGSFPLKNLDVSAAEFNRLALLTPAPRVWIGYSLGGRIGLHASLQGAVQDPQIWAGGVVISAHPGLSGKSGVPVEPEEKLRAERFQADLLWSKRFRDSHSGVWDDLVHEWNSQPVFQRSFGISQSNGLTERREGEFCKDALADALVYCSLAKQADLRGRLSELKMPLCWISGEDDVKFRSLMGEMTALNPQIQGHVISKAGHRVPWEQPQEFKSCVEKFLQELTGA